MSEALPINVNTDEIRTENELVVSEKKELSNGLEIIEVLKNSEQLVDNTLLIMSSPKPEVELGQALENVEMVVNGNEVGLSDELRLLKEEQKKRSGEYRRERLKVQKDKCGKLESYSNETISPEQLRLVHCTNFAPTVESGKAIIKTSFNGSGGEKYFTSVHFSVNHVSSELKAMSGVTQSWRESESVLILPYEQTVEENGLPSAFLPEDCWWGRGCSEGMVIPEGSVLITRADMDQEYADELKEIGVIVKKTEDWPYDQVSAVLEGDNANEILPEEFPNPLRFSVENDVFYGHHDPFSMHADSAEYFRNSGIIGENMIDSDVYELVEKFNEAKEEYNQSKVRYEILIDLMKIGYFEHLGHAGANLNYENLPGEMQARVVEYLYFGGTDAQADELGYFDLGVSEKNIAKLQEFKQGLIEISGNAAPKLPKYSKGYYRKRLEEAKNVAHKVQAPTLGMFIAARHGALVESYNSWD